MDTDSAAGPEPRNRILEALPAQERERLEGSLERVSLKVRRVVFEPNQPIRDVWFPVDAVVSILGLLEDGSGIETATVGCEGMVGVPIYLGASQVPAQAFAQVPGDAWRMPADALRQEVRRGGMLPRLLGRYTHAMFTLVAQSSACNRKHSVEQRCARWLLMTHDRVPGDTFDLTQQFLSQMLGVRRATVSDAATALQARGLVEYTRGRMTIVDRPGLEEAACGCYGIIRAEFGRMLEGVELPSALDGMKLSEGGLTTVSDGGPVPAADGGTPAGSNGAGGVDDEPRATPQSS